MYTLIKNIYKGWEKMQRSKVYFQICVPALTTFAGKAAQTGSAPGMDRIDWKDSSPPVKIHFGEPGNLAICGPTMQR
jgi:hypothetical protein